VLFAGFVFMAAINGNRDPGSSGPKLYEGLASCQTAIKQVSRNPATTVVPFVQGRETASTMYFDWPRTAGAQMQNGFGALLAVTASCEYNTRTRRVEALTVDGKRVM
jgi:hypothetical protein